MTYADDRLDDLLRNLDLGEAKRAEVEERIENLVAERVEAGLTEALDLTAATILTADEHEAIQLLAKTFNLFAKITGHGPSRAGDLAEIAGRIHDLQNAALAQAAARAYPSTYRLLGDEGLR